MIEITDATGHDEADILPTPSLDRQLQQLGFVRIGSLCAVPKDAGTEQTVAVWRSPDGGAFAVPEANPRGPEVLCYLRTLLADGTLVDTSDEPDSMSGFCVGRTRKPIRGARYDVEHHPAVPLDELWRRHRARVAGRPALAHRTMEEAVALAVYSVTLFSRVLRVGLAVQLWGGVALVVAIAAMVGLFDLAAWIGIGAMVLVAVLVAPTVYAGMWMARRLPAWAWPDAPV